MTKHWNVDAARAQYAIPHWGEGYFDVDGRGRLSVRPRGAEGPALALPEIVDAARARGSRLPLLVRFADILHHRLARLQGAFAQAMAATPPCTRSRSINRRAWPVNWRRSAAPASASRLGRSRN